MIFIPVQDHILELVAKSLFFLKCVKELEGSLGEVSWEGLFFVSSDSKEKGRLN